MGNTKQELYKKYRPKIWEEMVGQKRVIRSLQSAIVNKQVPPAYLFAGTHGSGKTTAAFILAKALNCDNPQPKGNPCNECDMCVSIDQGTAMGIEYISMANFNGVEGVRDLVDKAQLNQPVKTKVFILDEVHNLSKAAFDALLIPLERENNFIFILCTTEINKVPKTILSRVQQRKFNVISPEEMLPHLKKIGELENLNISEEDYEDAVRLGRGSARDSITALESIVETGGSQKDYGTQILESILLERSVKNLLLVTANAASESVDFHILAEQLFEDFRDIMLISSGVSQDLVSSIPDSDPKALFKGFVSYTGFTYLMETLGDAITKMSTGVDPRIIFETAAIKCIKFLQKLQQRQNS